MAAPRSVASVPTWVASVMERLRAEEEVAATADAATAATGSSTAAGSSMGPGDAVRAMKAEDALSEGDVSSLSHLSEVSEDDGVLAPRKGHVRSDLPAPRPFDALPLKKSERTPEDRREYRLSMVRLHSMAVMTDPALEYAVSEPFCPWDLRGPPGPKDGGPSSWRGQRWREKQQIWGSCGGKRKEQYRAYHQKKNAGLTGPALRRYHPKNMAP